MAQALRFGVYEDPKRRSEAPWGTLGWRRMAFCNG